MLSSPLYAAGWISDDITQVAVKLGNGCIVLNSGEVIKLDLNTYAGRAEFSIALAAKTSNRKLSVYQTDDALEGGCNTGTAIKPHSMLRIVE